MADRFYCPEAAANDRPRLEGDEARHLARVLRLGVGATVEVFDGRGFASKAEVLAVGKDRVELRPLGPPLPDRVASVDITLATAVPKGERFDWLVEKATELGVRRLIPLRTERSVVDPSASKLDRLRRAVVEASKQCGRNRLMEIAATVDWPTLLATSSGESSLLASPGGRTWSAWTRIGAGEVVLAVGPEGGFTPDEVLAAEARGWIPVGLGATVLRVETAALAGCARIVALGEANRERTDG